MEMYQHGYEESFDESASDSRFEYYNEFEEQQEESDSSDDTVEEEPLGEHGACCRCEFMYHWLDKHEIYFPEYRTPTGPNKIKLASQPLPYVPRDAITSAFIVYRAIAEETENNQDSVNKKSDFQSTSLIKNIIVLDQAASSVQMIGLHFVVPAPHRISPLLINQKTDFVVVE